MIWRSVLLVLVVLSSSLGACAAQEEVPDEGLLVLDTVRTGQPPMMADGRTVKQRLEDATVAAEVQKALLDTTSLRLFDFEVEVARGRVALRGSVHTETQRMLAASIAREVDGVKDLINQIALLPPDTVGVAADSTGKEPL
jgi:hypothetical protein